MQSVTDVRLNKQKPPQHNQGGVEGGGGGNGAQSQSLPVVPATAKE